MQCVCTMKIVYEQNTDKLTCMYLLYLQYCLLPQTVLHINDIALFQYTLINAHHMQIVAGSDPYMVV